MTSIRTTRIQALLSAGALVLGVGAGPWLRPRWITLRRLVRITTWPNFAFGIRMTPRRSGALSCWSYTIKGSFTLMEPSSHNNYYGLAFGGSALEGADQTYLYFLVAQDGSWLIKRRVGNSDTESVEDKTTSDLVKKPDASGKSVNALEVRVKASSIDYVVNGSVVHTTPKSGLTAMTDGLLGFRINHALNVMVDGLESS